MDLGNIKDVVNTLPGGLVSGSQQGAGVSGMFASLLKGGGEASSEGQATKNEATSGGGDAVFNSLLEASTKGIFSCFSALLGMGEKTKDSESSEESKASKTKTDSEASSAKKDIGGGIASILDSVGGLEGIASAVATAAPAISSIISAIPTGSPVALDLNGSGEIETTGNSTAKNRADGQALGRTVDFDLDGDGSTENIEWMSGDGDGLLIDNRDGAAASSMDGSRLFGDQGGQFGNGYNKMATLDRDGDQKLSGKELEGLEIWVDDGDAKVEDGELKKLSEFNIDELSTNMSNVSSTAGESLMRSSANNGSIMTEDVWFGIKDG